MVKRVYQSSIFFFFQAEDGIRDLYVTGVQTCALPILRRAGQAPAVAGDRAESRGRGGHGVRPRSRAGGRGRGFGGSGVEGLPPAAERARRSAGEARTA